MMTWGIDSTEQQMLRMTGNGSTLTKKENHGNQQKRMVKEMKRMIELRMKPIKCKKTK